MPSSRRLARSSSSRSGKAPQTQTDAPTNHQPPSASARRPRRVFSSAPAVSRSGSLQPRFYGGDDAEADAIWPRQALGTRIDGPTTPPMRRRSSAFRALLADRLAYCAGAGSPNGSGHDAGLGWRPRHRPGNGAAGKRANPVDLDDLIPSPRYTLRHSRAIDASPEDVWDALHELPVSAFPLTWSLEALRLLPARIAGKTHPPLAGRSFLEITPIPVLFSRRPRIVILGGISQAWRLGGGATPQALDAAALRGWSQPGWIKVAMDVRLEPIHQGTSLRTETRVIVTDPRSDRAFARYWLIVRPAAATIRREVLRVTARRAEARADSGSGPGSGP